MQITSQAQCQAYIEGELKALIQSHPEWHVAQSALERREPLTWVLGRTPTASWGWYLVQGDLLRHEVVIWFGSHQVCADGLHWIMRPAVHVAFADLHPRDDPIALCYSLRDVLASMIRSLDLPATVGTRFDLNSQSLT